MNEASKPTEEFSKLVDLISDRLPDLRCLRCHHDGFYLSQDLSPPGYSFGEVPDLIIQSERAGIPPITTLVCRRCGHIEQHLTSVLINIKPTEATP
ncbi:hypothetical protein [Polymorphum gilvum]|uniref:Uncharacterized protein n=1 Tax=Polymorphum gilvum (strain LMG 25793 / CGMCC 1.9160 / SL003B-26A1) TaxID=991905 RepID=F2IX45_POLGS|nr:hypothetical protein [Polymorphum gilvum]ADZ69336.1 hypothetical protein SL003B_0907 [Polymorphum gilvum SL003B-26A1]